MNTISNNDDVIDSRDVIARIEELQGELANLEAPCEDRDSITDDDKQALVDWCEEYQPELAALLALQSEAEGYAPDWRYGAPLVRDDYFTDYAMELLADIGALPREIPAYIVIDEDATAENIKVDYTSVEFDGVKYWIR